MESDYEGEGTDQATGDVYTMVEAARLKGVSYHTVSRAVRRGKLPAQRLGRMALIAAEDLRAWRPMRERAPHKYRRREPNPAAAPALLDLASGERVELASRLSLLFELIHGAAELPLPEFMELVADRAASTFRLRRVAVVAFDREDGRARRVGSFGPAMGDLGAELTAAQADALQRLVAGGEPAVVDDLGQAGVGKALVVPLTVGGRVVGALIGDANGAPFDVSPEQLTLAQGLGLQAAIALDRARLAAGTPSIA